MVVLGAAVVEVVEVLGTDVLVGAVDVVEVVFEVGATPRRFAGLRSPPIAPTAVVVSNGRACALFVDHAARAAIAPAPSPAMRTNARRLNGFAS